MRSPLAAFPRNPTPVVLVVLLGAGALHAQASPEDAVRRTLIEQATAARGREDHAGALLLGQRVLQLRATPSAELFVAEENTALGHVVEALAHARSCAHDAEADTTVRNRERLLERCHAMVEHLSAMVANVVRATTPAEVPAPVPDALPSSVPLFALEAPNEATQPRTEGPSRAGPVTLFVVGGLGAIATGVLWGMAASASSPCPAIGGVGYCMNASQMATAQNAPTYALAGNVLVGVSAAAILGGVLWWALSGHRASEHVELTLGPMGAGVMGMF